MGRDSFIVTRGELKNLVEGLIPFTKEDLVEERENQSQT